METPAAGGTVASFEGVGLRYGDGAEILHDVSFRLATGSFHFLLGASGAGKTSLLRLLYLALRPTSGALELFGTDIGDASRPALAVLRRRIGIVFQDFRLLPQLSLYDNVAAPLRVAGIPEARVPGMVLPFLSRMGLEKLAKSYPPTLSGGQQQLAAIARAVIVRPRLLVADEPTASVDGALALRLIHLFQELNRLGTTVLIATHNEALADRFHHPRLRLDRGRLTSEDRTDLPAARRDGGRDGTGSFARSQGTAGA